MCARLKEACGADAEPKWVDFACTGLVCTAFKNNAEALFAVDRKLTPTPAPDNATLCSHRHHHFPTARHDGSSWHSTDRGQSRRGAVGSQSSCHLHQRRLDGIRDNTVIPSWTHRVHPCPMCFCSPDTMHDLKDFILESAGWDLKTIDHYIEECERREIHVVVGRTRARQDPHLAPHHTPSGTRRTSARANFLCSGMRMSKHGHSNAIHCSTAASVSSHNGCSSMHCTVCSWVSCNATASTCSLCLHQTRHQRFHISSHLSFGHR